MSRLFAFTTMIIDCDGPYAVLPATHDAWCEARKAPFKACEAAAPFPDISDVTSAARYSRATPGGYFCGSTHN